MKALKRDLLESDLPDFGPQTLHLGSSPARRHSHECAPLDGGI